MIGSATDTVVGSGSEATANSGAATSVRGVTDGLSMKRSAASMLSGKKPVQAVATNKNLGQQNLLWQKRLVAGHSTKASAAPEIEDVEPGEMSLEEIEERLSTAVKAETISQLKSTVWKERLEAIGMLKQEVESLSELDKFAELLVRLLCSVP